MNFKRLALTALATLVVVNVQAQDDSCKWNCDCGGELSIQAGVTKKEIKSLFVGDSTSVVSKVKATAVTGGASYRHEMADDFFFSLGGSYSSTNKMKQKASATISDGDVKYNGWVAGLGLGYTIGANEGNTLVSPHVFGRYSADQTKMKGTDLAKTQNKGFAVGVGIDIKHTFADMLEIGLRPYAGYNVGGTFKISEASSTHTNASHKRKNAALYGVQLPVNFKMGDWKIGFVLSYDNNQVTPKGLTTANNLNKTKYAGAGATLNVACTF